MLINRHQTVRSDPETIAEFFPELFADSFSDQDQETNEELFPVRNGSYFHNNPLSSLTLTQVLQNEDKGDESDEEEYIHAQNIIRSSRYQLF